MPSPCTVTAQLQTADNQNLQGNAFVRFKLRNFAGFVPRVIGTNIIAENQVDELPNASGQISATIWGNDNIDPSGTFYTVEYWNGGRITSQANFILTGNAVDLDTVAQMNPPTPTPATSAVSILLQTNGTKNGSQTKLNLVAGPNITVADDGIGDVTISGSSSQWWDWLFAPLPGSGSTSAGVGGGMSLPYPFNPPTVNPFSCYGCGSGAVINSIQSTSEPVSIQYVTGAIAPRQHGFIYNATWMPPLNALRKTRAGVKLNQTTNSRLWIVLTTGLNTTQQDADTPNVAQIGFRYSSGTDTQFMCYCGTSNVAFTAVASGVNVDTNFHTFEFDYTPTAVTFFIDGNQVAVITTNIPPSTTIVNPIIGISNKNTANAVSFQFYFMKGTANSIYA